MSEIPYFFNAPVPKYFRETGWFNSEHMFKYVHWAFSRCSTQSQIVILAGREVRLAPYEFVSGRLSSSKECFLSENVFRNQQKTMLDAGLLKKSTNSLTNQYSCYIWVTDRFIKKNNQQNNQQITNDQPTTNHVIDTKIQIYKEQQPQTPSFNPKVIPIQNEPVVVGSVVFFECLKDLPLSESEKLTLMKFPQDRVSLAVEWSRNNPPKKSLIAQLVWHCQRDNPPANNAKNKENNIKFCDKYFKKYLSNIECEFKIANKRNALIVGSGNNPENYAEISLNENPNVFKQQLTHAMRRFELPLHEEDLVYN